MSLSGSGQVGGAWQAVPLSGACSWLPGGHLLTECVLQARPGPNPQTHPSTHPPSGSWKWAFPGPPVQMKPLRQGKGGHVPTAAELCLFTHVKPAPSSWAGHTPRAPIPRGQRCCPVIAAEPPTQRWKQAPRGTSQQNRVCCRPRSFPHLCPGGGTARAGVCLSTASVPLELTFLQQLRFKNRFPIF